MSIGGDAWQLARVDKADELAFQLTAAGITPFEREYVFHPQRKWRLDVAFVPERLAVEVEGGIWQSGRHNRPAGFIADIDKYNALTIAGWHLLRVTPQQVKRGEALVLIEKALGRQPS